MTQQPILLLIDSNSLLNRAHYGLGRARLTAPDGTPTGALYAFLNIIFKYVDEYEPERVLAAYDLPGKVKRHERYADYKAGRRPMPEDLALQMPIARELTRALGYGVVTSEGYEADDVIGTLAARGEDEGYRVIILSGDRDTFQLISEQTAVQFLSGKKGPTAESLYTPKAIMEAYGVSPDQWVDVKALMGDASDNIPGVKGVGKKTALKLIAEYGTLDAVYNHLADLKGALLRNLESNRERAYLSRDLARIERDIPLPTLETPLCVGTTACIEPETLADLFSRLDFRSMAARFPDIAQLQKERRGPTLADEADALMPFDDIDRLIERIRADGRAAFLFDDNGRGLFVTTGGYLETDRSAAVFAAAEAEFVTWDIKGQLRQLRWSQEVPVCFDIMIAAYLLNRLERAGDSEAVLRGILGERYQTESSELPLLDDRARSRRRHAYALLAAAPLLEEEMRAHDLAFLCEIEMKLALILASMEKRGVCLDLNALERASDEMLAELHDLEQNIYALAGHEFNVQSPQQLSDVLFGELKLPPGKKTTFGYSTAANELERLRPEHPIIPLVMSHRELAKLRGTFLEGMKKEIEEDGRIRTSFNQTVTSTGRLSSSGPNLQNIPVRSGRGSFIRRLFRAGDGYRLVDADYSQIELRLLAHLSGDEAMRRAFIHDEDIHRATAAYLFHKPSDHVTPEERGVAKTVNFSITYGISEFGLSRDLGVPYDEAALYIRRYKERYPKVAAWLLEQGEKGKQQGYVETYFHRRRYLPELESANRNVRQFGLRAAMNAPVQGTAADLIKIAMVRASEAFFAEGLDAQLILQVHDELIVEASERDAERARVLLQTCMEEAMSLSIPLVADAHIGTNWGDF